jgi:hypothetical protein
MPRFRFQRGDGFADPAYNGNIILTDKGRKLIDYGSYSKFARMEKFALTADNRLKWTQKYWWLIMILTAIVCPLLVELLKPLLTKDSNQSQPTIQVVHDTVYIHDSIHSLDTLKASQ